MEIVFRTGPATDLPVGLVYMGIVLRVPEIPTDMIIECGGRKIVVKGTEIQKARDRTGLTHVVEAGPWSTMLMSVEDVASRIIGYIDSWDCLRTLGCVSMGMFRMIAEVKSIRLQDWRLINLLVKVSEWRVMARCRVTARGSDESYRTACRVGRQTGSPDVWFTALKIYGDKFGLIDEPWVSVPRDIVIAIHRLYPRKIRFLRDQVGALMVRDFCRLGDRKVLHILYDSGFIHGIPLDMYIFTGHSEDIRLWNINAVINLCLLVEPMFMEWLKSHTDCVYHIKSLVVLPENIRKVWWDTHRISS